MTTFLKATMKDGTEVLAEFSKLAKVQRYVTQVMAGTKPFNVWSVVGRVHPVSGEDVLSRTRTMYNGRDIQTIVEVTQDGFPKVQMQRGTYGVWTAPEGVGVAPEGTEFPLHRDALSGRRYVVARAGTLGEADEVRHYIDPEASEVNDPTTPIRMDGPVRMDGPADGDDDDE